MSPPSRSKLTPKRNTQVFAALGDPTRLSLVSKLCTGPPCSIARLTEDTKLTRQAVTKHLRVLERAHLVHGTRDGRETLFAFNPEPIEVAMQYLDALSKHWDEALDRLRSLVER